jgi:hypothetical protein
VRRSLKALLTGVVDYAGMFPPAQLALAPAIRNYARYRTEPEKWMLGRFICPAVKLGDLSPLVDELFASGPPLGVSLAGAVAIALRLSRHCGWIWKTFPYCAKNTATGSMHRS